MLFVVRQLPSFLHCVQLYGNPLEYLPELAPAVGLRSLSLANVRILADTAYSRCAAPEQPCVNLP